MSARFIPPLGNHPTSSEHHPRFRQQASLGERAADKISEIGGSWWFIIGFVVFLVVWICLNGYLLISDPFDPFPFILLNLILSVLAAIQAPIILMAENRQAQHDRVTARYDHAVNRKAEREIRQIQKELASIRRMLHKLHEEQLSHVEKKTQSVKNALKKIKK